MINVLIPTAECTLMDFCLTSTVFCREPSEVSFFHEEDMRPQISKKSRCRTAHPNILKVASRGQHKGPSFAACSAQRTPTPLPLRPYQTLTSHSPYLPLIGGCLIPSKGRASDGCRFWISCLVHYRRI